jgi:hypothetical protein
MFTKPEIRGSLIEMYLWLVLAECREGEAFMMLEWNTFHKRSGEKVG